MFFEIVDNLFFVLFDKYGRVAAAHYGEARAYARPARRGARSTPRGYAPLESSGNDCLRQPMHIASDIPVDGYFVDPTNLKTQQYLENI